ncbi:MAG TPA: hydroxyacid dehydrogenase [Bacillota bacterium]|nr:hydroxyacid dehydrogenase [Bacillota bacterium]HPW41557.1 hydroxyacid dehydrogenase [Bacillota bacterium]
MEDLSKFKVFIAEPISGLEDTYQVFNDPKYELIVGPPVSCPKQGYTEEQLIEICKDADVFLGMARERITRNIISASPKLRIICKYGNGVDNIDVKAASEYGIIVSNAPVHNMTVAEYAFSMILSVLKKIPRNMEYLKNGGWRDNSAMGNELYKKTVGIVGFGAIGKQLAKRFQGWEVNLLVCDPLGTKETAELFGAKLVDWDTIFEASDVISIHLPLMESTRKIIGEKEFAMMKKSAVFVNTSRGPIVDESALIEALRKKEIAGAGIDVFMTEPVSADNPMRNMENVVLTPHVAGYTAESLRRISEQCTQNCIQALKGEIPEFVVNRDVLPKWKERFAAK